MVDRGSLSHIVSQMAMDGEDVLEALDELQEAGNHAVPARFGNFCGVKSLPADGTVYRNCQPSTEFNTLKEAHPMADFEFIITETTSMVDLEEYLNYLITERCNEIYYKIITQDAEYQNLQSQLESCIEELLKILPEPDSQKNIAETLWTIIGNLEMLLPRITYQQAFKDGVRLKRWLTE